MPSLSRKSLGPLVAIAIAAACFLATDSAQTQPRAVDRASEVVIGMDSSGITASVHRAHSGPVVVSLDQKRLLVGATTPLRVRISARQLRVAPHALFVVSDLRTRKAIVVRDLAAYRTKALSPLTIVERPSGPSTNTTATISWRVRGDLRISCSLDGAAPSACSSPMRLRNLSVGSHRFVIYAKNRSTGTTTTNTVAWTVTAPADPPVPAPAPAPPAPAPVPVVPAPEKPVVTVPTTPVPVPVVPAPVVPAPVVPAPVVPAPVVPAPVVPAPVVPAVVSGVAPVVAPSSYALPAGAVVVRDAAGLVAALGGSNLDIVLADGVYDRSSPFTNAGGYRLYAEHVGGAVLRAGMIVGSNSGRSGAVLRGLTFDVSDPARAFGGGEVHIWGPGGANVQVLDCVFRGGWAVPYGLLALNPSGLVLKRSVFSAFTDVAARISNNSQVAYGGSTPVIDSIEDVAIDGVSRSVPGASNGTAEAGLWIGHPVRNGVHRIRVRNVSWSGIETVNNAWDTQFTDLDVNMGGAKQAAGVAVYMEHYTRNVVFDGFSISGARVGFAGEWADPQTGGVAGAYNVVIRNGVIDSAGTTLGGNRAGVYLDEGSYQTTVTGVTFRNQNWAGIGAYRTAGTNTFTNNTFQLAPGAAQISPNHI